MTRVTPRRGAFGAEGSRSRRRPRGIEIPRRTDCARCPYQRLHEWRDLWTNHPEIYAHAEAQEERYGHTFRSAKRDTWPADLKGLRVELERGVPMRGDSRRLQRDLFEDIGEGFARACRVCTL